VVEGEEVGEDLLGGEGGWPAVGGEDGQVEGAVGVFQPCAFACGAEVCAFEGDHGDVDGGTFEEPLAIGPCPEDCCDLVDSFEDVAVCASADALSCQQVYESDGVRFHLRARFFEPADDQVGFGFDATFVEVEEVVNILIVQFATKEFAA